MFAGCKAGCDVIIEIVYVFTINYVLFVVCTVCIKCLFVYNFAAPSVPLYSKFLLITFIVRYIIILKFKKSNTWCDIISNYHVVLKTIVKFIKFLYFLFLFPRGEDPCDVDRNILDVARRLDTYGITLYPCRVGHIQFVLGQLGIFAYYMHISSTHAFHYNIVLFFILFAGTRQCSA